MPVKVDKIHIKEFDKWIEKKVSALISQLRVFSAKRIQDKLAELDSNDFEKVKGEVIKMISFSSLPKQRGHG